VRVARPPWCGASASKDAVLTSLRGAIHTVVVARASQGTLDERRLEGRARSEGVMWLEAILSRDDLVTLVERFLPVKIHIGTCSLTLYEPREVRLVAARGLLLRCKARVHWPVLGIAVPIVLHEFDVMLWPEVESERHLVFRIAIEHADLAGVPAFIDDRITLRINRELREHDVNVSWDFAAALTRVFQLPGTVSLADALSLDSSWGRLRIRPEAMVLAVSLHADVLRQSA
jgi:hypothetical protein